MFFVLIIVSGKILPINLQIGPQAVICSVALEGLGHNQTQNTMEVEMPFISFVLQPLGAIYVQDNLLFS